MIKNILNLKLGHKYDQKRQKKNTRKVDQIKRYRDMETALYFQDISSTTGLL
jgi:hypothetical protein